MAPPLDAGLTLSGHLLTEEIGEGGYARVFRSQKPDGTAVALKVAHRPEAVAALRAEAEALRQLQGPRFVKVLEEHLDAEPPFLVLEHYPRGDLRRLLARQDAERLDPERALDLFSRICEGVAEAHERDFVHGDLKPDNVLLDEEDEPRLADFGLSRDAMSPERVEASIATERARVRGTYDYLAPELRRGEAPTPASDVYALGVILYELLIGTRPIGRFETVTRVLAQDGVYLAPEVGLFIDSTIETALSPRPEARPSVRKILVGPRPMSWETGFGEPMTLEQAMGVDQAARSHSVVSLSFGAGVFLMMGGTVLTSDLGASFGSLVIGGICAMAAARAFLMRVPTSSDLGRFRRRR